MIDRAVAILRRGGLVGFPTETVYGLGADATNAAAVRRIFAAKGRPSTNPLIVHVSSVVIAKRYATHWPAIAEKLAERFWPGPLTLVLPKTAAIVDEVSAGLATIGLRVPHHPVALALLTAFDGPVAAPSANRSNHISPTQAAHVRDELGDSVDLILDGGPCTVGIESTVLHLTGSRPKILRPGGVSQAQIESVIGPVEFFSGNVATSLAAASPGQHERHYSPRTPAFQFSAEQFDEVRRHRVTLNLHVVVFAISPFKSTEEMKVVQMPDNAVRYAQDLYRLLREWDLKGCDEIHIELPPPDADWQAVRDRVMRAAAPTRKT